MAPVFTIDTHTHVVPEIWREMLISAGYATKEENGTAIYVDGFRTPDFSIETYLANRKEWGYNYSVMSITCPGVSPLNGNARAKKVARELNDQMAEWIKQNPGTLGAWACLPLPDVEAAIEEARYCLDELKFDGIGLYTNYNGRYIGDHFLDPLFEELNRRKATVFVHPTRPVDEVKLPGMSTPVIEYCFDSTRAVANMLFTKGRERFPDMKFIFSHGGGALPFLAGRLALQTTFPFHGGWDYDESLEVLKSFYYDIAVGTSAPQLAALTALVGTDKLLFGSDYPHLPAHRLQQHEDGLTAHKFSEEETKKIRHGNALSILPTIKAKIDLK